MKIRQNIQTNPILHLIESLVLRRENFDILNIFKSLLNSNFNVLNLHYG